MHKKKGVAKWKNKAINGEKWKKYNYKGEMKVKKMENKTSWEKWETIQRPETKSEIGSNNYIGQIPIKLTKPVTRAT